MKPNALLTIASLLSILLMTLHVTDDIVRGLSPAAAENVGGVAIFVVWLFGTLALPERRSGYVIMLLGGLFAAAMPVLQRHRSCCREASRRRLQILGGGVVQQAGPRRTLLGR